MDRTDYEASLARGGFHLILADYSLPGYDGMTALSAARNQNPDTPFSFVSGSIGEELAVAVRERAQSERCDDEGSSTPAGGGGGAFAPGGALSGPLMPQPAISAQATSAAARRRAAWANSRTIIAIDPITVPA